MYHYLYSFINLDKYLFAKTSDEGFYSLRTGKLFKKRETSRLKNFPAGYAGSFYRSLADNVENLLSSAFYGRVTNDVDNLSEDVQRYILATTDFAKGMQTDINHYVTRDRINNASVKQKLDQISKNILRRQNPLELVFEHVSAFDAENPIVGSLLRELDLKKKAQTAILLKIYQASPVKILRFKKG